MAKPASSPKKSSRTSAPVTDGDAAVNQDALPDEAAIQLALGAVRAFLAEAKFGRVVQSLQRLQVHPPAVLLFEGGSAAERLAVSNLWAVLLNCPHQQSGAPCLECPVCVRMVTHMHRDCFFMDGLAESIKIGTVRDDVRPFLGEPPREVRYRIVVFREAQTMTPDAANLMLKSLEEPVSATSFILTAPQRERLLPTLVSRSMIITLPWTGAFSDTSCPDDLLVWEVALCRFLTTGQALLQKTGQKGALDNLGSQTIVNHCRRALARALGGNAGNCPQTPATHSKPHAGNAVPGGQACAEGRHTPPAGYLPEGLESLFATMPQSRQRMADEVLGEAQDSLLGGANPALVIEWLATRLFFLMPRSR